MASTDSVTLTINLDLSAHRAAMRRASGEFRLAMARIAYVTVASSISMETIAAAIRADEEAAVEDYLAQIDNTVLTDARDAYYTARDLTEEPR